MGYTILGKLTSCDQVLGTQTSSIRLHRSTNDWGILQEQAQAGKKDLGVNSEHARSLQCLHSALLLLKAGLTLALSKPVTLHVCKHAAQSALSRPFPCISFLPINHYKLLQHRSDCWQGHTPVRLKHCAADPVGNLCVAGVWRALLSTGPHRLGNRPARRHGVADCDDTLLNTCLS